MVGKKPFISVVITNKNALKWLPKCLTSLEKQTYKNFEVVFVDNMSTDDSLTFVKKKFPWVRIVINKVDGGFAGGNNVGVKNAKGEYVLLMNTDAFIDRDCLQKLSDYLKKNPSCHFGQLDERRYDKTFLPDRHLIFGMDPFGYPIGTNGRGPIFYADGAALLSKRSLYLKLGGFDEAFYLYLEDMDLSWRMQLAGEKVYYLENIPMYHYGGGTSVTTQATKNSYTTTAGRRYHAQKNNIRALIKNYSIGNLVWALPGSILLAFAEAYLYLLKGNVSGFIAIHKSVLWNLAHLNDTLSVRQKIQQSRKVKDDVILKNILKKVSKFESFKFHGVPLMR
jgi:GT2 family glycosyltransferase